MNEIFDIESWQKIVVNALTELGANVGRFLPSLVGTVFLLLLGWVVSKMVEAVVRRVLRKLGLDQASSHTRIAETLKRAGVESPLSSLFARVLFWILMLTFILSAVETLGLSAVTSTIDRLIGFLPNVLATCLIVVLGLLVGRLARNVVSSASAAANVPHAQRMGNLAGAMVVLVVSVLALEQLGVETALLVTVLTVLVAAVCLTVGLSFAMGARPIVTHILAGHFLRQSLPPGSPVEVDGQRGNVERVGPTDTLVRGTGGAWSIPNAALLEETIGR